MVLKSLNTPAKLAVTFFLGSVFIAVVSALILLGLILSQETSGVVFPSIEGMKLKYGTAEIVSSMKTSMYEHVTEDESIEAVEQWILQGTKEDVFQEKILPIMDEDCTNCHSKSSTMSDAMPNMPLTKFSEVEPLTMAGYSWKQMSKQAHLHLFGITVFLVILSLLMAYTSFLPWIKYLFIILSSLSLWTDILGWWLTKYFIDFVYVIFVSGGFMSGSIIAMSFLIFIDLWFNVPWIARKES